MSEAVILCEGYYDRAFWAGWLEYFGCPTPADDRKVIDPRGELVSGGRFGYYTKSGQFVCIVPCHGRSKILPALRSYLGGRQTRPVSRVVVCVDPDTDVRQPDGTTGLRAADVEREVRALEPRAAANADGDIELDAGATKVSLVRWEASDPQIAGVPTQQCLERVVCAALVAAYPDRGPAIQAWLGSRPAPPPSKTKEHAWSHMAGWYAEHGCQDFYKTLWKDPALVRELKTRLEGCGAWRIAEMLVAR